MKPIRWFVALVALTACAKVETVEATQVLLRVSSELHSDAVSHQVRVSDDTERLSGGTATIFKPPPFSFALVPAAKSPALNNMVSVSALDATGNVLATAKTLVTFVDQKTVQVDVRITEACRGVVCDPTFTCAPSSAGAGECVPVQLMAGRQVRPVTMEGSEFIDVTMEDAGLASADAGGLDFPPAANMTDAMTSPVGADAHVSEAGVAASEAGLIDAGPPPACDATRPCGAGFVCKNQVCVSACDPPCQTGATCSLVNNVAQCSCRAQASSRCDSGHLYWFDSCGNRGTQQQSCTHGCAQGACQAPITVTLNIVGSGRIDYTDSSGSCTMSGCRRTLAAGTEVVLTATATAPQWMTGWSGPCTGQDQCRFTPTNDVTVTATFGSANLIFTTSATHAASMGGLAGADALCQSAAPDSNTYKAWLAGGTTSAASRLGSARGWVRPDGKPVADTVQDILAGRGWYAPNLSESGTQLTGLTWTWAGTDSGENVVHDCANWTRNTGNASLGAADGPVVAWRGNSNSGCDLQLRLVCMGTGRTARVHATRDAVSGRLAFVTAGAFTPTAGGISAADALCRSEAMAAGRTGSFKALLASATASAASRMTLTGATWVTPAGLPIFGSASQLNGTTPFAVPIAQGADGTFHSGPPYDVWTGAPTPNVTSTNTCGSFANPADSSGAYAPPMGQVGPGYFGANSGVSACNDVGRVICLEQ